MILALDRAVQRRAGSANDRTEGHTGAKRLFLVFGFQTPNPSLKKARTVMSKPWLLPWLMGVPGPPKA